MFLLNDFANNYCFQNHEVDINYLFDVYMLIKKDRFYILNILVPLIVGGLIYLLYGDVLFVKVINNYIDIKAIKHNVFINILRNYFCDFCWSYSLAFALSYIYKESISIKISIVLPISIGIILELLQLIGLINGTFDLLDIFSELLACVVCYQILRRASL